MRQRWIGLLLLSLWVFPALAVTPSIPPVLKDWQGWVLHDQPKHGCPFLSNQYPENGSQCVWPGELGLEANANGGRFALQVHVDAPSWVVLPGDSRHWPQAVTVNGQSQPVLQRGNQPMLWLEPGEYQLRGELPWQQRPAQLRVPMSIALVSLRVDGDEISQVERNGEQVTLGEAAETQRAADALSIRVYRMLSDGLPGSLETRLQLDVAGSAREVIVGPALPSGFVAIALSGQLPARLENDGKLRLQLRPGQWTVVLSARATDVLTQVELQAVAEPWPVQEVWSYADHSNLRTTRVQGQATDATQAGVPGAWQSLPAFAMGVEHGLSITQESRGMEGGQGDQVQIRRDIWLDFNGKGLTIADRLSGELRQLQRLNVTAPWTLERAEQAGQSLLVTRDTQGGEGVEIRDRQLDFKAGLRMESRSGRLPSTGWQLPVEQITGVLHLPYGYRLLAATGTDDAPDAWVAQWNLLDMFVVALITLLAGRLLGWRWAAVAVVLMVLGQHESGIPRWTVLAVLALALLMRALPEGRLQKVTRWMAIVALVLASLWAIPFIAQQMHYALHPQLEGRVNTEGTMLSGYMEFKDGSGGIAEEEKMRIDVTSAAAAPADAMFASRPSPAMRTVSKNASYAPAGPAGINQMMDSRSLTQAGGGVPKWEIGGKSYRLNWSGPITAEQMTRLVIVPSWVVRCLRVLLVAALLMLLAGVALRVGAPLKSLWKPGRKSATALLLLSMAVPMMAQAQNVVPPQETLNQLQARLTERPECVPACASLSQALVEVQGDTLNVLLQAHAGADVALPLPLTDSGLQLQKVAINGKEYSALARVNDGVVLRLERGVHGVLLRYRIGNVDSTNLRFAVVPQQVKFSGQGWQISGVDEDRLLGDNLALSRQQVNESGESTVSDQSFPPFVRLTRRLVLGLDWTVVNTLQRISPEMDGFTVSVPLLAGEHALMENAQVRDGQITMTFSSGQSVAQWSSRLDRVVDLTLTAPTLDTRAEVWEVAAAPIWRVDAVGVPLSGSNVGLSYLPLPGEELQLKITQPGAVAGDSVAFDSVKLSSRIEGRASETTLDLRARSTRGGEHVIDLPEGAELLGVSRDGEALNLVIRDGKLGLPLLPGEHSYSLRLRQLEGVSLWTKTPSFKLNAPSANIELNQQLPKNRWVLLTGGPTAGPAVLYWSQLAVLLLLAVLLARFAPTPLRLPHWILLGLGFSAFSWGAYAFVVGWLIVLGLRSKHIPLNKYGAVGFNLAQIALVALTGIALIVLVTAVPMGLLSDPDMHINGMSSSTWNLNWMMDQADNALPQGGVLSVSIWFYKVAILAWALWLANALMGWLRWGFGAWSHGGYWRKMRLSKKGNAMPPIKADKPVEPKES